MRWWVAVLVAAGCVRSDSTVCDDGRVCPEDLRCAPGLSLCVTDEQLTVCTEQGIGEGAACPIGGVLNAGFCYSNVCIKPTCGDGIITAPEQCDGELTAILQSCSGHGYYDDGVVTCAADCTYDKSACNRICGDHVVDPEEACDPAQTGDVVASCLDSGFYQPGEVRCNAACQHDVSSCSERCGDDIVNGTEACDGAPPHPSACAFAGFDAGQVTCASGCYDSYAQCRAVDFRSVSTDQQTGSIEDIWGIGQEFFAVGDFVGAVMHTTGGSFVAMPGSPSGTLYGVWGSSPTDVFAVGRIDSATFGIYHYDGLHWTKMSAPASPVHLHAVWGNGPNDVWAVGDQGRVLHYTSTWADVTTPISAAVTLRGVWTTGQYVFIAGTSGAFWRFNGAIWEDLSAGATDNFVDMYGVSATEIYLVTSSAPWRFSGVAPTALPTCIGGNLRGVGGMTGGPTFVVGNESATPRACQLANGRFEPITMPNDASISMQDIGGSSDVVYAGGSTLLKSFGANWLASPGTDPIGITVEAIWGTASNNLYIVGVASSTGNEAIQRWTGAAWSATTYSPGRLYDVTGGSGWAVAVGVGGRVLASNGSGGAWGAQTSNTSVVLREVWGDPAGTAVYAVGDDGTIVQRTGTTWSVLTTNVHPHLSGVWGSGTTVFAVGDEGTILRKEGTGAFMPMTSPTAAILRGVWGRSATDVYAVGQDGAFHFDGTAWRAVSTGSSLWGVGGSAGDIFSTTGNQYRQLLGGRAVQFMLGGTIFLRDIAGTADTTWFLHDGAQIRALAGRLFRIPATETSCGDFWDDDHDGLVDCADPECAASALCLNGGACAPYVDLACGTSTAADTTGGSKRWDAYGLGCVGSAPMSGPERYYRIRRPTDGTLEVSLTGFAPANLDVIVSSMSASGACTPDMACLASAQTTATTETASFAATANTDYIVIVDGPPGESAAFTLQVNCP